MFVIQIPILNRILILGGENDGTNMSKLGSVSSATSSSSNLSDQGKYEKNYICLMLSALSFSIYFFLFLWILDLNGMLQHILGWERGIFF